MISRSDVSPWSDLELFVGWLVLPLRISDSGAS